MNRIRLDQELVRRGLCPSRSAARNAVRAGFVLVEGMPVTKPAHHVDAESQIALTEQAGDYVGRGAYKLLAALADFSVPVAGRRCVDVGASTGGFTQVLLESGAEQVVAIDVGRDQLHDRLRRNPRVVSREGTNVRDVSLADIDGPFDVVTADLSFISLTAVAGDLERLGSRDADWIVLIKPQFEVGRSKLSKDGVVRSAAARGQAVVDLIACFAGHGLVARGLIESPILGGSGNREALLWLSRTGVPIVSLDAFKVLAHE